MAISFVQWVGVDGFGPSQALTFTSAVTANSTLIAAIFDGYGPGDTIGVTDSLNGAWTRVASGDLANDGDSTAIFYLPKSAAGTCIVTVTSSGGSSHFAIHEFAIDPSGGTLDEQVQAYNAASNSANSGNTATTTAANELVFGALIEVNGENIASQSGTVMANAGLSPSKVASTYNIVSSTGVQNATFGLAITDEFQCYCATFKAAAGGGAGAALAGAPSDAASASGALTTAVKMAGAAIDAASASAQFTNFASVLLTSPQYEGIGGIYDPNFWLDSTPLIGSTLYYDPTFITVEPDGEIVATTNNCTAVVQFYDPTGSIAVGTVVITPQMVGYLDAASAVTGALSTGIRLVVAASSLSSAAGALGSGISLIGAVASVTSATGQLSTAIQLAAAAIDAVTVNGSIDNTTLAASLSDTSSATGALVTQIQLAVAAASVTTAAANLATQILMGAGALSLVGAQGTLTSGKPIAGALTDASAATGTLSTAIQLAGAAADLVAAAGSLLTQAQFVGAAISATSASGALATNNLLAAAASSASSATATLQTLINLTARAATVSVTQSALSTGIQLGGAAFSGDALGSLLTDPAWGGPVTIVRAPSSGVSFRDGPLPFGVFFQRVGTRLVYGIDWTGWLALRWQPATSVMAGQSVVRPTLDNGYQYPCEATGETASQEPMWPIPAGAEIEDGSAEWECAPIDGTSLAATILDANWATPPGVLFAGAQQSGQMTLVLLDTTSAIAGVDYDCDCTVSTSTGEQQVGKIRLKVR